MTARITRTTRVPADVDTAFDLSLTIEVHVESFSKSQERAVEGVTTGVMGLDEEVTWKARHFGRVWTMKSKISTLDKPTIFVDEQVRGPFRTWHHTHRFTRLGNQVTEMVDDIVLRAPFGILGWIAERIGLTWYMGRLMDTRNAAIVAMARERTASGAAPGANGPHEEARQEAAQRRVVDRQPPTEVEVDDIETDPAA